MTRIYSVAGSDWSGLNTPAHIANESTQDMFQRQPVGVRGAWRSYVAVMRDTVTVTLISETTALSKQSFFQRLVPIEDNPLVAALPASCDDPVARGGGGPSAKQVTPNSNAPKPEGHALPNSGILSHKPSREE